MGFTLADVAADELIRDVATHHFGMSSSPRDEDTVFEPVMTRDYGGDFDFSLEYTQVMLIIGLVALVPALLLGFTVSETPRDRRSFYQALHDIWSLVHNSGLNYVLLCRFVGGAFAGVSATAVNPVAFYYADVQPLNDTVVSFVAIVGVLWALSWVDKKGWNVNYRTVIVVGTITTLALDLGATMFTIWDVVRSQWFWIGLPVMEAIPSALDYTISTVILTEVADPSAHFTMSGLLTSVSFLAGPLGLAVAKYVGAQFDVSNQDVMTDTTHAREQLTMTFFIAYAMQLASLLWLFALPKHASEALELKLQSGTSTVRGVGLLLLLATSLPFVVAVHVLSVYEPTACLDFSGGPGC
ncbi:hypothetical protein PHYPSEUDO_001429 [Phytophthora pseudosyringae]|uniref:Transmembrane protein n=1 Tax=Phytophthora pseudosyringae TaxID=221518 RepID=A0A8T1VZU7_9STRA|nr:hypothetical protein PHYPSEUDO_001429 [Phytophthora pseudosyringae]